MFKKAGLWLSFFLTNSADYSYKTDTKEIEDIFFSLNTVLHIRFFAVTGRTKAIDEFVNCFRLTVTRNIESIDNPRHRVFSCRVCY